MPPLIQCSEFDALQGDLDASGTSSLHLPLFAMHACSRGLSAAPTQRRVQESPLCDGHLCTVADWRVSSCQLEAASAEPSIHGIIPVSGVMTKPLQQTLILEMHGCTMREASQRSSHKEQSRRTIRCRTKRVLELQAAQCSFLPCLW